MSRNVVAVGPHPDDVEVLCMGTLLRLRAEGASVTIVTVSAGERGAMPDAPVSGTELVTVREREARSVADTLEAPYICLDAPDHFVQDTPELRTALARVFQAARADVIFAPSPADYHADHTATSALAMQAALMARGHAMGTEAPLIEAPAVYYYDTLFGQGFEPGFYIDIGDVIEEKKRLAEMHASQTAYMGSQNSRTLTDMIETLGRFRGSQSMTTYAEAFQISGRQPRVRAWRTLPFCK
jgi:LmbE family N-acetylglucosaminyl deacetylase